jgi:hypothetical protein
MNGSSAIRAWSGAEARHSASVHGPAAPMPGAGAAASGASCPGASSVSGTAADRAHGVVSAAAASRRDRCVWSTGPFPVPTCRSSA